MKVNESYGSSHDLSSYYESVKRFIASKVILVSKVDTKEQRADAFTKTITGEKFKPVPAQLGIFDVTQGPHQHPRKRSVEIDVSPSE